jgi:hypothetical protein
MGFATQPIPYPAAHDYGPRGRWPTLGVTWHVAEGRNVAQYLSRDPARGVSVHYTVEQVGPFLRQWLDEVARPTIRASTYESYSDIVTLHLAPGLGRIALAKLTPADVQSFLNRKAETGLSPRRVQMLHAVLRRALVTAERWGSVSRNVARLVDAPRVERHEIAPLTPEQAHQLFESATEDRYRALWVTALATGLRRCRDPSPNGTSGIRRTRARSAW